MNEHFDPLARSRDPVEALITAVNASDIAGASQILRAHPELKPRLNEGLPEHGFGSTLLMCAVQRANKELIDLLLEAGADINARSHWWAGSFGVLDNDHGLAEFLISRGAVIDAHAAARLGMLDKLKALIGERPELVHARGGDGQTPLHFASTVEIAEYLLEHGADINALDVDHESTPAQYMVKDRQEVARHLVARGCRTDIFMAAALGILGLVRQHLETDPATIYTSVSDEYFPRRDPRAGGTIYIWTLGQHQTPHLVARQFGHEEVFELLMEHSPPELKLAQACELGDEQLVIALQAKRSNLIQTWPDRDRCKVAHAAQHNNANSVRLMLQAGWPADARGQHGATPLHWAAFHGNVEMTKIILQHGPPLECVDSDFCGTPLGWAIYGSEHGWHRRTGDYPATAEALLRAGARLPLKPGGTETVKAVLQTFGLVA